MTNHRTGTRAEWLAARLELLEAEKALTRRSNELARRRQQLPWVPVEKDYRFTSEDGDASLRELFGGRSQLLASGANGNGYGALLGFGPEADSWDHSATIRESPIRVG
jgi:hypothetical protein